MLCKYRKLFMIFQQPFPCQKRIINIQCVFYGKLNKGPKFMKDLTLLEQMILAAVIALKENAYGVSIRKRVEQLTGKRLIYGTLYNALDQLLRKRYVAKTKGTTSTARGGRPRIYYELTAEGKQALRSSYQLNCAIWESIPEFLRD